MSIDDVLHNFKAGTISHQQAHAWISLSIERAAVMAKLEVLDKVEADIAELKA